MFKPGHPENHGVNPNRGDVEGNALGNAGNRDVESDLMIGLQDMTVGNGDSNRRAWFGGYLEE